MAVIFPKFETLLGPKKNLFYGVKTTWIYDPLSLSNHDLSLSTGLIYSNVLRPSVHNGSISTGG